MSTEVNLDDPEAMLSLDSGELLRATATAGAQVRVAVDRVPDAALDDIARDGSPRAVVVVGTGGSGICGELLSALARASSSVPVLSTAGPTLPGWVGPLDVVVGISTSGQTRETLAGVDEAVRRGARVVGIGGELEHPSGPTLAARLAGAPGTVFLDTADPHRPARVSLWSLLTPLLLVADRLGVVRAPAVALARLADRLDSRALEYGPVVPTIDNPAKELALVCADTLPVIIGTTPLAAASAARLAAQLGANAKIPAFAASAPEAISTFGALLDGPYARPADLFRDPFEDPGELARLSFVLISGGADHPITTAQAEALADVAQHRDVTLREVRSQAREDLAVLGDLISIADFASVYVALARGSDPWASPAIPALRAGVSQRL